MTDCFHSTTFLYKNSTIIGKLSYKQDSLVDIGFLTLALEKTCQPPFRSPFFLLLPHRELSLKSL